MSRVEAGACSAAQGAHPKVIDLRSGIAPPGGPVGGLLKRATDIALAATSLVLLAPMFLLLAALLHLGLARPVFVAQQRIGFGGRRFTAYKFSTTPTDRGRQPIGDSQLATCVVGLLQNSGLDRLPELISVLRGDMSFVGPRPIQAGQSGPYPQDYLAARPGLTGAFRTNRSGLRGDRRRAATDRYYVRRWSIWLDLAALTRSVGDAS